MAIKKPKTLPFESDAEVSVSDSALSAVSQLAKRQILAEDEVAELTVKLSAAQQRLNAIMTVELPQLMTEHGLTSFSLKTGEKVEVKSMIKASIPKEHYDEALNWLRANGHEGLIKNEVVTSFGKGEDKKASKVTSFCEKNKIPYDNKQSVHPQTLSAFVREQLEKGEQLPMETLGVHEVKSVKITRKK